MKKYKITEKLKFAYQTFKHCDKMMFPGILMGTEIEYDGISPSALERLGVNITLVVINKEGLREKLKWNPFSIFGR